MCFFSPLFPRTCVTKLKFLMFYSIADTDETMVFETETRLRLWVPLTRDRDWDWDSGDHLYEIETETETLKSSRNLEFSRFLLNRRFGKLSPDKPKLLRRDRDWDWDSEIPYSRSRLRSRVSFLARIETRRDSRLCLLSTTLFSGLNAKVAVRSKRGKQSAKTEARLGNFPAMLMHLKNSFLDGPSPQKSFIKKFQPDQKL